MSVSRGARWAHSLRTLDAVSRSEHARRIRAVVFLGWLGRNHYGIRGVNPRRNPCSESSLRGGVTLSSYLLPKLPSLAGHR